MGYCFCVRAWSLASSEALFVFLAEEEVGATDERHVHAVETQSKSALVGRHQALQLLSVVLQHVALEHGDEVLTMGSEVSLSNATKGQG